MLYEPIPEYNNNLNIVESEPFSFDLNIEGLAENIINNSYYIKFDANGGEGTMSTQMVLPNESTKLLANKFTKEGSLFVGWRVKDGDKTVIYTDEQSVKNLGSPKETITLEAIWTSDPEYDKDVVYTLTTKSGSYTSEPQMRYSALIEYRNRTEDSVEIRITWTAIKEHGYNSYGQNFEFSCGGVSSGGVRICGWDGLAYGYASATKESGWVKISLNTSGETTVKLTVKYWQTDSNGSWYNEKINTTWTIEIPAAK